MGRPTIGVVIATPGRRSLLRTINSIQYQGLVPGDDVLIVGDGFHQPTADLVAAVGAPFRYVATEKTRDWGHSQQNYGLKQVGGDWLLLQDDDDVFLPRAFDEARNIISKMKEPKPLVGRVMTPYLGILWTAPGKEPLDGHCLVVPNDKSKVGYFGTEYAGDQVWLASNLSAYESYVWADRIWTLTRPTGKLWPRRQQCSGAEAWTFHRDDGGVWGEPLCHLVMTRGPEDEHWSARFQASPEARATEEEVKEVVEFAAWAGQGSDVWFVADAKDSSLLYCLNQTGYQMHQVTESYAEFVFEWPPHKFEPRGPLLDKEVE